ncbi:hypothetical protein R1flu_025952 [Riccia fluitans]|uniref:ABC-2 type transporter transmembrane domain-containing protein n=1 Tax=Riccia fluitans TaxID=41844 RepID=A0ABD1XEQ7_9MARC
MKDFFVSVGYDFGEADVVEPVLDLMQEFQQTRASVNGLVEIFQDVTGPGSSRRQNRLRRLRASWNRNLWSDPRAFETAGGVRAGLERTAESESDPGAVRPQVITTFISAFFWAAFSGSSIKPLGLKERLGYFASPYLLRFYTCADTLPIFLQWDWPGGAYEFLFFLGVISASFWAGNSFATFLSAIITNVITGYSVVIACLSYFLLLSGFFITRSRIPNYWIWFHYISAMKYPFEAVLINEFESKACYETAAEMFYGTPLEGSKAITTNVIRHLRPMLRGTRYANLTRSTCLIDGHSVLRNESIGSLTMGVSGHHRLFGLFYRLLFYVALRLSGKVKRH